MDEHKDSIEHAMRLVQRARDDETEDGNPLAAAWCYITAMEHVTACAIAHTRNLADESQSSYFLYQVHAYLEEYYKRAELLIEVALSTGLTDKANLTSNALSAALFAKHNDASERRLPAPQYNFNDDKRLISSIDKPDIDLPSSPLHYTERKYDERCTTLSKSSNTHTLPSVDVNHGNVPSCSVMGIPMCDPDQPFANFCANDERNKLA